MLNIFLGVPPFAQNLSPNSQHSVHMLLWSDLFSLCFSSLLVHTPHSPFCSSSPSVFLPPHFPSLPRLPVLTPSPSSPGRSCAHSEASVYTNLVAHNVLSAQWHLAIFRPGSQRPLGYLQKPTPTGLSFLGTEGRGSLSSELHRSWCTESVHSLCVGQRAAECTLTSATLAT